jgi:protease-4
VRSLEERFFGRQLQTAQAKLGIEKNLIQPNNPLLAEFEKFKQEIAILQKMNDPQGIYARLPFNLKID